MSGPNEQQAASFWRRPQVQALVQHALGSSGLIGIGIVKFCHWANLPAPDLGTITEFVMAGIPLVGSAAFSWWHDHPNNLVARAVRHINGDEVSPAVKSAAATAIEQSKS